MNIALFIFIGAAIFVSYTLLSNKQTFGKYFQFFSQHLSQERRKKENAQILGFHLVCLCFSSFLGLAITFLITKLSSP